MPWRRQGQERIRPCTSKRSCCFLNRDMYFGKGLCTTRVRRGSAASLRGDQREIATGVGKTKKSTVHFDLDFIAVGIESKRTTPFACGAVAYFYLCPIQAFALDRSNHVANTSTECAQTKM